MSDSLPGEGRSGRTIGVREVAERAQVAISSVSRVLTDHPNVSEQMRARVLAAVEDLGYEPDLLAQSLRRGRTYTIGFVVRDISNPILAEIALGAETALSAAGYSMLLANSHGEPDQDAAGIHMFRRRRVDGLLLSLSDESNARTREELKRLDGSAVLIDREMPEVPTLSAVLGDHATSARQALRLMIDLGHRHIGVISGSSQIYPMREIDRVVREVCGQAGVKLTMEAGPFTPEDGAARAERLLSGRDRPTALLTTSNQIFVGALHVIQARGLRIPDDLSIVTFDDIPLLDLLDPPIGVISRLPREIGRRAAEQLIAQLRDDAPPRTIVTPTSFEPRGSLGPSPSRA